MRSRPWLPWLALALAVWAGGVAKGRLGRDGARPRSPPWQRSYLELTESEQRLYRALKEGLFEAENRRADTKRWPEPEALAADGVVPFAAGALLGASRWISRAEGTVVNYVGFTQELEWLVLILEPDGVTRESAPPDDEEHHTIPDGTALHVTVWTRPVTGARASAVLSFPATQGWTQRVGR